MTATEVDLGSGSSSAGSAVPGRVPPQDLFAEQCTLGAMLLSVDAIGDVQGILRSNDWYQPKHQTIHEAISKVYERGEPVDAITIADELAKTGALARIGGAPYLHTLTSSVPNASSAAYYAKIVNEQAVLRHLIEAGTRISQMAYSAEGEVNALVEMAQTEVFNITNENKAEDYQPIDTLMPGVIQHLEAISDGSGQMVGVPTGFRDLDELTNGLQPGQMVVIAARPAMGKSTLGLDIARNAAIKNRLTSAIFSLEMDHTEIMMRLLSAEAKVKLGNLRNGRMSDDDWMKLANVQAEMDGAPLFIDDSPNLTLMEIRAKCRRLAQQHDLRLVVIDYLQLMTSGKKVESRQMEVSEFSRSLKLMAKELGVPVIAISQLNRGPEQRTEKVPMMSDLRESGAIEQDADMVILLHRPDVYNKEDRPGEADFNVAKHRNGPTRTITTVFQGHYSRFVDSYDGFPPM